MSTVTRKDINNQLAKRSDLHLMRKVWHISCGVFALVAHAHIELTQVQWSQIAFIISLVGFSVDFLRLNNNSLNSFIIKVFRPILRRSESESFSGLPFYALGIALSLYFFPEPIALLSTSFLVFADPVSSLVGASFGRKEILPNKTLQGSTACFLACFVVSYVFLLENGQTNPVDVIIFSLLAAFVGTISELCSAFNIDDNLTIPLIGGAGITLINFYLPLL